MAAAFPSGLVEAVTLALTGPGAGAGASFGRLPAVVTVAAGLSYVAAARARRDRVTSSAERLAPAVLLSVAAAGAGAAAIGGFAALLPPGAASASRTTVLALAAVFLAAIRARTAAVETGWLAWGILGAAALVICVRDLPTGHPATLFAAFVGFGLALMAVARITRRARPSA